MKYLDFDIELKSISPKKQLARPKVFTNDLDSVMIRITITDMTDTDLLGSSAEMLLYMQDRSFFQNTDVTREGNVFKYLLKENEGNHSGIARFQLPVTTADEKVYAQQKLEFEIISGLETKVATEVMIHDWTTLTREARAYIDEFKLIVNDAKEQVQANIVETAVGEKFNNLEAEYAEDLTQVKSQLAEKATKETVSMKRDKSVPIDLNDVSSTLLGAIQGGTTVNVNAIPRDYSVNPTKTTFARRGKNKFEENYNQVILTGSTDFTYTENENGVSSIVRIDPDKTYTISKSLDTNRFRIALYVEQPQEGMLSTNTKAGDTADALTITTGVNETYMVIYVSSLGEVPSWVQVEEGSTRSEYAEPSVVFRNIEKKSIPADTLEFDNSKLGVETFDFIEKTKNIFDGNFRHGYFLSGSSSTGLTFNSYVTGVCAIQAVKSNTAYTVTIGKNADRFRIGVFDEEPGIGELASRTIKTTDVIETVTIETQNNESYIVIYASAIGVEPEWVQIEEGDIATDYSPPFQFDKKLFGDFSNESATVEQEVPFVITDIVSRNYEVSNSYKDVKKNDTTLIYSQYDTLVSDYPDYVKRTLLDTEPSGLPIYKYDFEPPESLESNIPNLALPKVLYVSGTHGMEREAITDGIRFFADLCENWQSNEALRMLRWNVHFSVIPLLNPYGFDNGQRKNANGVDINRNMPHNWTYISDTTSDNYAGEEPLSEIESQVLDQFIKDNNDALFAIDHHNFSGYPSTKNYAVWIGSTNNYKVSRLVKGLSSQVSALIQKYSYISQNNLNVLSAKDNDLTGYTGMVSQHMQDIGVPSVILETVNSIGEIPNNTVEDDQEFSVEVLGNLILSAVMKARDLELYK